MKSTIAPKFKAYIIFLMILFIVLFICFIVLMYNMKNTSIIVTNENLTVKSLFYGQTIPLEKINVNGLQKLNLYNDQGYNIKSRSNGIGLPNYYVGWMILNNGNKAFVYLADRTNVVLIPTDEYDILISTDNFYGIEEMLNKRK